MIADSDQKSVLLRLHDQIDEAVAELSAAEISHSFRPKLDPSLTEAALDALVVAGLIVTVSKHPTKYRISRAGIAEVESSHEILTTINPGTGIVHRSYTERLSEAPERSKVDWTMWGTILTAIALVVSILIAVIT